VNAETLALGGSARGDAPASRRWLWPSALMLCLTFLVILSGLDAAARRDDQQPIGGVVGTGVRGIRSRSTNFITVLTANRTPSGARPIADRLRRAATAVAVLIG